MKVQTDSGARPRLDFPDIVSSASTWILNRFAAAAYFDVDELAATKQRGPLRDLALVPLGARLNFNY